MKYYFYVYQPAQAKTYTAVIIADSWEHAEQLHYLINKNPSVLTGEVSLHTSDIKQA